MHMYIHIYTRLHISFFVFIRMYMSSVAGFFKLLDRDGGGSVPWNLEKALSQSNYLEKRWLAIMGYVQSIMGYFGVVWQLGFEGRHMERRLRRDLVAQMPPQTARARKA